MFAQIFSKKSVHASFLRNKERSFLHVHPVMRLVSITLLITTLIGCATVDPERLASVDEAYPTKESYNATIDVPAESCKKASFNAPYDEVFRAVTVAMSGKGLNIESSDKTAGVILATSTGKIGGMESQIYYAAKLSRVRTNRTDVLILSKGQQKIKKPTVLGWVVVTIGTLGLMPILYIAMGGLGEGGDSKRTELHWTRSILGDNCQEIMSAILADTRSKLYTGGSM
jgi:hypothetical protein